MSKNAKMFVWLAAAALAVIVALAIANLFLDGEPITNADLIEILTINRLHYSHGTESGVLFHLIGAVSQYGKLGMTAIANSPEEVDALYGRTLEVLDSEARMGRPELGSSDADALPADTPGPPPD